MDVGREMVFKARVLLVVFLVQITIFHCSTALEDYEYRAEAFGHIKSDANPTTQQQAVHDLIARLLPKYKDIFFIKVDPKLGGTGLDKFAYVSVDSKLSIRCTTGVACAMAVNHFLKNYCKAHVSWSGDQLEIPSPFPVVKNVVTVSIHNRFRYYQNVCTSSYSFIWWDWTRWQREVDWMALNGINLPLAFTGQEAIWQKVYLKMGLKQEELDSHFGGPAFLAWSRMGNVHGWGGPLPPSWYKNQLSLQHNILTAMRNLGMAPILPGFAGHVPKALTRIYPKANLSKLGDWGHFNATYCCTYLLDASDPLFKQIGGAFIKAQIAEFGTNHIYNADTFNEMTPRSSDPAYLAASSKGVYQGMLAGDADAIWLMQGWLFWNGRSFWKAPQIKALLQGVPQGKMIVLDLMAETTPLWKQTDSFYGQPFIWCMLHNFGGNLGMYGTIDSITTNPVLALQAKGSTMIGTGLTPEGINQNYIMYDLMNEMGTWINTPLNTTQALNWVESYATRRYGSSNAGVTKAWKLLSGSVYNCTDGTNNLRRTVITDLPSLTMSPHVWFDPEVLYQAWDSLVSVGNSFSKIETFRHDLVDVTREALHLISIKIYKDIMTSYQNKDSHSLSSNGTKLVDLLSDLDTILMTNEHFLLGQWLKAAKAQGTTKDEVKLYEYNARNQITLWGPTGEIDDYANKMWSGLVSAYYKPRWQLFVKELVTAVSQGKEIDLKAFKAKALVQGTAWTHGSEEYTPVPKGDSVEVAKSLNKKYR